MNEVQPVLRSPGPARIRCEAGWLLPCGVILVTAAVIGYGWIVVDILVKRPLLCEIETHHMFMLDLPLASGIGFLAAAMSERISARIVSFLASALVAGAGGALLVALLYSTQCASFEMFVRQLVGL